MSELAPIALHAELRALIASSRQRLAGAVNAELTRLYWNVGQRLRTEVLGKAQEFGRGFESRNLRRMVKFAESFPDVAIVSTLSTQLSWSHMVAIVALKTPQARQFYASRGKRPPSASSCALNPAANRWSCCKCTKTASPWPNI